MSLARDITTVGGGTLMSRLLAYARDAWIAALLGAGPYSETLFAVLQVVNFFRRLLSEGALNSAFVPIWSKLHGSTNGAANANRFTRRVLLMMFCVAGSIVLLAVFLGRYIIAGIAPGFDDAQQFFAALLLSITAPYILLAGLVAVIAAALSAEGRVGAVAITTVLFNLTMLLALLFVLSVSLERYETTAWVALAVTAAGTVQLLTIVTVWLMTGKRWQRTNAAVRDQVGLFFGRALPGLIATGIPQLKLIAAIAIVSASPSAVSWLYYANRLYELPLGIASIGVAAAIVPRIASSVHARDTGRFAAVQSRAYELSVGLALPAATGFALLAEPIARGLFERGAFGAQDTAAVAAALVAICAGLPGHVLEKVFGAVSFAHEDTHTPMLAALSGLAAAIAGGVLLLSRFDCVGVAAAIAMSGWVGAGLLGATLWRRGWLRIDTDARRRLPRICLATLAMAGVVGYSNHAIGTAGASSAARLAILAALVTLGIAVYLAALRLLRVMTLKELAALQRKS
ncbi:MAG TPA: murein biosynthesis integral membrane protein MurJ [Pseudolabrys sp.]|nr:murein biosynthesis integral membrane protein MurJ [Pseudolabrys sp.]